MACVTSKTAIPFVPVTTLTYKVGVHATVAGDTIWISFHDEAEDNSFGNQLYKFDTDSFTLEYVDCVFPDNHDYIREMTSDGHNIYAFFCETTKEEEGLRELRLFKFNVNTHQWEFIMPVEDRNYGPIVGNQMYFIRQIFNETTEEWRKKLMRIDLSSKEVAEIAFHANPGSLEFMENNGKVFIKERIAETSTIVVLKLVNEKMEEVDRYCYDNVEELENIEELYYFEPERVKNGFLLQIVPYGIETREELDDCRDFLEWFDFKTNKWKRTVFPKTNWKQLKSDWIVKDDKCFAVCRDYIQYSIHMIDLFPKLSTICIMSQIDRTNNANDFEAIKASLSQPLRHKLENMLEWKIAENDITLGEQQKVEVFREMLRMADDGILDHGIQRELHFLFDSDFSDYNDSNITDAEYELSDESDSENGGLEINDERRMWLEGNDHRLPDAGAPRNRFG